MVYTDSLSREVRHAWEERLLKEADRLRQMTSDIIPPKGHMSITAFPNGHVSVDIYSGENTSECLRMVVSAWANTKNGELEVCRVE